MREANPPQGLVYYLVIPLVLGLVMAKMGPFGTFYDLTIGERVAFWVVIVLLTWLQVDICTKLLGRFMSTPAWPLPAAWLGGAITAAIPATLEVQLLRCGLGLQQPCDASAIYFSVALMSVPLTLPVGYFNRRLLPAALPTTRTPVIPSFFRRIPTDLDGDLVCLEMENHYLRIHTTAGSAMIRCRMRDAVAELQEVDGARVHRSYWVARRAVREISRNGDRLRLVLTNGLRVPVSRTYRRQLRASGWLDTPSHGSGNSRCVK